MPDRNKLSKVLRSDYSHSPGATNTEKAEKAANAYRKRLQYQIAKEAQDAVRTLISVVLDKEEEVRHRLRASEILLRYALPTLRQSESTVRTATMSQLTIRMPGSESIGTCGGSGEVVEVGMPEVRRVELEPSGQPIEPGQAPTRQDSHDSTPPPPPSSPYISPSPLQDGFGFSPGIVVDPLVSVPLAEVIDGVELDEEGLKRDVRRLCTGSRGRPLAGRRKIRQVVEMGLGERLNEWGLKVEATPLVSGDRRLRRNRHKVGDRRMRGERVKKEAVENLF